jgi:phosphate starvation-inducible membrane PsiE
MKKILTVFYLILVMVLVSLKETYSITNKIFYPGLSENEYTSGPGFLIHIVFFSLLVLIPVYAK